MSRLYRISVSLGMLDGDGEYDSKTRRQMEEADQKLQGLMYVTGLGEYREEGYDIVELKKIGEEVLELLKDLSKRTGLDFVEGNDYRLEPTLLKIESVSCVNCRGTGKCVNCRGTGKVDALVEDWSQDEK